MKIKRICLYVAGPMTGYKDKNFPVFAAATKTLRKKGYKVISPAELDTNMPESTWEACLKRDIKKLVDCDAIATLEGWWLSRGATLETDIGTRLGMDVMPVSYWLKRRLK